MAKSSVAPPVNFDANATYGPSEMGLSTLTSCYTKLFNPSAIHQGGQVARALLEAARDQISHGLYAWPGSRVVFTSGATEANNAVFCSACANEEGEVEVVVSAVEHPSVIEAAKRHASKVTFVAPRVDGLLYAEDFISVCTEKTRVLSLMAANNETGQVFPVREIFRGVRARFPDILLHCDAVQAIGKIDFPLSTLDADFVSISAHKIGGLPGVGALIVRGPESFKSFIHGGPQERRYRAGTENVLGIISFGAALTEALENFKTRTDSMRSAREIIFQTLSKGIKDIEWRFRHVETLPNTLNVRIPRVFTDDLVVALDLNGVWVSSGSACASGKPEPSHVLLALGLSEEEARSSIRISLRADITPHDAKLGADRIVECVRRMRDE